MPETNGKTICRGRYQSPIGELLLESDGAFLTGLRFGDEDCCPTSDDSVICRTRLWLDSYFRGENPPPDIPMNPQGTPFQLQVWQILRTIPYGKTVTYGEIAREMAQKTGKQTMSSQAVGQAVGRNPMGILIPCHRCIGAGGKLTGYAWGIERKQWLLHHEKEKRYDD